MMISTARRLAAPLLLAAVMLAPGMARAADIALTLKDHHFSPAEVTIPAHKRVRFAVTNQDKTPAEFESDDFQAEKLLPSGQTVIVITPALKPGTYEFHDEYNEAASKSRLVVTP